MNLKVIVTIFLLAAVPVYAQAQNPGTARVSIENDLLGAEFTYALASLDRLCTK